MNQVFFNNPLSDSKIESIGLQVTDQSVVFEIKAPKLSDIADLEKFMGPKNRFSKYSRAVIKLNQ